MPMPQTIPPMNWLRASLALRMRPAANAPTRRVTRTMPRSGSTSTSANCAPKECSAYFFLSSEGATSPRASTGFRGRSPIASSFCRNARQAASTAEATLAAVSEPLGPQLVAATQRLAGEGLAFGWIGLGVVLQAEIDGIDAQLVRQLVDGGLQGEAAARFAGRAHVRRGADVEAHQTMSGLYVLALVLMP